MVDKSKQRKKGTISEDDISSLLQRYSVNSVLALLQEVAQAAAEKLDWHDMVKNTATGISGAKEYQTLWRHLAYGETLNDQFDHDGDPMDDDSDLEYDLEAFPAVGREASSEAAACVKVLIASGYPNDSNLPNNTMVEAPLTINIPNNKAITAPSDSALFSSVMQGTNISIPVSVQKQPSGEKRPNNGPSGVNLPPRRRRRGWSTEEDTKLTAAVEKYGERWAHIARGDFKNDRKANELSNRWTSLGKKQANTKVGTSSQHSETQLAAAHRALSLALNMPMGDNLKSASQMSSVGIKSQHQSQKPSASPAIHQMATKRLPSVNPTDSMVKAAAVAAGARIATSADASSLIEAARSQNVVHITTGASSVMKSSTPTIPNQLPSNVHFIRNGLAKAPISSFSSPKPTISRAGEAQPIKPAVSAVQNNSVGPTAVVEKAVASTSSANELKVDALVERVLESQSAGSIKQSEEIEKGRSSVSGNVVKGSAQGDQASVSVLATITQSKDDRVGENDGKETDNQLRSKEIHEKSNSGGMHEDLARTV